MKTIIEVKGQLLLIWVPEEENRKNNLEARYEEIVAEIFPELRKDMIEVAHQIHYTKWKHSILTSQNSKNEEKF